MSKDINTRKHRLFNDDTYNDEYLSDTLDDYENGYDDFNYQTNIEETKEETEDYSNNDDDYYYEIETIEEQYSSELQDENFEMPEEIETQSIFQTIFLSLTGKQTEYTKIDKKLNNNASKIIFMITSLLFLILVFVLLLIFIV